MPEQEQKIKGNIQSTYNIKIILLVITLILMSMFSSCDFGDNSKEDDIAEAVAIAQDIVKENLKVPSSADFPWGFDDYKISCSGNKYTVGFIFEAENSFGAKLKQIALVTYTRTGSYRYTYNPSDIYIGD